MASDAAADRRPLRTRQSRCRRHASAPYRRTGHDLTWMPLQLASMRSDAHLSVGRPQGEQALRARLADAAAVDGACWPSLTPPDVEVRFYDDRLEEIPFDEPTDLVAMSVETFTALRAYRIARQFRARGVPVVMGGYHVTLLPEEAAGRGRRDRHRRCRAGLARSCSTTPRHRRLQPVYDGRGRRVAGRHSPAPRDLCEARTIRTSRWSSSPAAAISSATSARSPPFTRPNQNHRPADEVAAEMAATGSRRFFIVDDNIVSQPAKCASCAAALIPLGVSWVGQASIHIAQDDELLELMVAERLPGRADRHGIARPGQPARHGQELEPGRRPATPTAWPAFASMAWPSTARLCSATTTTTGTLCSERAISPASRNCFWRRSITWFRSPARRSIAGWKRKGGCSSRSWWLDPDCRVGDVVFRPKRMSPQKRLEELCLEARRRFTAGRSIFARLSRPAGERRERRSCWVYLGLNVSAHYDIDRRQGLRLGSGAYEGGR